MTRPVVAAALVAALLLAATPAHADDTARASELYEAGKRSFDLGDYEVAIDAWKTSYLMSSAPLLLFNLGQAYRLSGDCARANHFYLTYQRAEPSPPNPTELTAAMAKCAGVAPVGEAAAPPATVDDPPAPRALEPVDAPPSPGAHRRPLRIAGLVSIGVGGVAALASVVYALSAHDKAATIADLPAGTPWTRELADLERAGRDAQGRARLYAVVGAVAVLGGATMWWLGRRRGGVELRVAITPTQGEAVVACAF